LELSSQKPPKRIVIVNRTENELVRVIGCGESRDPTSMRTDPILFTATGNIAVFLSPFLSLSEFSSDVSCP
jgi:hypothetical protein